MSMPSTGAPRARRRRWLLAAVAGIASIAMLAGGWAFALAFESPAQREANAAPPTPRPITATVERGDLRDSVTIPATVARQDSATTSLPSQSAESGVVTDVPIGAGAELVAGHVVTEVNGAPIVAFAGAFAFYRDLASGDLGPDVRQLQRGLADSGYRVTADGVFGAATERAVRALAKRNGLAIVESKPHDDDDPAEAPAADASTITIPRAALLVVPTLPATVTAVPAIGTTVDSATSIGTAWGPTRLVGTAPARTAARLGTTGAPSTTSTTGAPTLGEFTTNANANGTAAETDRADPAPIPVRVETITPAPDDDTADATLTLTPTDGTLDPALLGREGTVRLDLRLVAEDALLVPTIAVRPGGAGPALVRVAQPGGTFRRIAVTEVAHLRGRSAVRPVDGAELRPGDVVRVD